MQALTQNKISDIHWNSLACLVSSVKIHELRSEYFLADFYFDDKLDLTVFVDGISDSRNEYLGILPHASENMARVTVRKGSSGDFNRWMITELIKSIENGSSKTEEKIGITVDLDIGAIKQAIVYGSYSRSQPHVSATDMLYFDTEIYRERMTYLLKSLVGLYDLTDHPGHWIFDQMTPDFKHPDYNEIDRSNFRSALRTELDDLVSTRHYFENNPAADGDVRTEAILEQFITLTTELLDATRGDMTTSSNASDVLRAAAKYIEEAKGEHEYFKYLLGGSIKIEYGFELIKDYAVSQGAIVTQGSVYFNTVEGTLRISQAKFPTDELYGTRIDIEIYRGTDSAVEFGIKPAAYMSEEENLEKLLQLLKNYEPNTYTYVQFRV